MEKYAVLKLERKSRGDYRSSKYATMNNGRIGDPIFDAWYARISEAVNKYQPDMIWFDTGFGGTVKTELKGYAENGRLLYQFHFRMSLN